jgi:hypothetical protein
VTLAGVISVAVGIGAGFRLSEGGELPIQIVLAPIAPYALTVIAMFAIRAVFEYRSVRIPLDIVSVLGWGLIVAMYGAVWITPPSPRFLGKSRMVMMVFGWGMMIPLFGIFLIFTIYGSILKALARTEKPRAE